MARKTTIDSTEGGTEKKTSAPSDRSAQNTDAKKAGDGKASGTSRTAKQSASKSASKSSSKSAAAKKSATKKPTAAKAAANTSAKKTAAKKATAKKTSTKDAQPSAAEKLQEENVGGVETAEVAAASAGTLGISEEPAAPQNPVVDTSSSTAVTAKGTVVSAKGGASSLKSSHSAAPSGGQSGVVSVRPKKRRSRRQSGVQKQATIGRSKFTKLKNVSEIRHYLRTSDAPVFFIGATAFNLLGLDRWVRGFSYITYYDSWDGIHPRVFTPGYKPYIEFQSGEEINNWLLCNHEVRAHIERNTPPGQTPQVVMVFFDEETEQICEELDYDLILPSAELRSRLDSKIVTTELANSVGVPSVPNVLTKVKDWDELVKVTKKEKLGQDLVIQTAYGDSGKTTYFVSSEAEFAAIADDVTNVEIKVMRRINNRPIAIEAVLTRYGTIVGPCMTEITGHRELTPYRGGWAGNEMFPSVLDDDSRAQAGDLVRKLGDRLGKEGYRGFFEVDVLLDTDTGDVYLGELNPRVSGASAITNVTAGAYADVPLFAFHLLEYSGIDFEIDVDEINERWGELAAEDEWSQVVIKHTENSVAHIDIAPRTGRYVFDFHGNFIYAHPDNDWHLLSTESEAFFLRICEAGDYWWKGADLGVLVTKAPLETDAGELTLHAKYLIQAIRDMYSVTEIEQEKPAKKPAPGKGQ